MIYKKGAKTIQYRKGQFFQQMMLEKLNIHMQKNEVGPIPYTIYKWIISLNIRAKIIKLLKGNLGGKYGTGFGNGFIDTTMKAQATK